MPKVEGIWICHRLHFRGEGEGFKYDRDSLYCRGKRIHPEEESII